MEKIRKMNKGEHEKSIEKAKQMIDKGCGMSEILAETHLNEEGVMKAKKKLIDQS